MYCAWYCVHKASSKYSPNWAIRTVTTAVTSKRHVRCICSKDSRKGHKICLPVRSFSSPNLPASLLEGPKPTPPSAPRPPVLQRGRPELAGNPWNFLNQKKMAGCKKCLHWYAFIHPFATDPHYQHFSMLIRKSIFFRTDPSTLRIQIITIMRVSWRLPHTPVCRGIIHLVSSGKKYRHP